MPKVSLDTQAKNEVALGADLNDLFKEFGLEKEVFWDTNLYLCWVWCEVHDNCNVSQNYCKLQ